jgi:hypothetical protein
MDYANKVGFAICTGRCGTLFLYQLLDREPAVASSHERNEDNETFHRYCQWHRLPVDDEGFLAAKEQEIQADLATKAFSFEASPHLSLSVRQLHERFGAKFVMLVRRPDRVVSSFVHKGFYRRPYHVADVNHATGYQSQAPEKVHTFFARVAPTGEFFRSWNDMTRVGKVAWFWRQWNERTLQALSDLPEDAYRILRIEDLDYARYVELSRFLGYEARVTQADFDALSESKPHAFWRKRNIDQWTPQEVNEFESQVGELARQFDYEYHIANLVDEARAEREQAIELGHIPQKKQGPQFWRLRRGTAKLLRGLGEGINGLAGGIDVK